MLSDQLQFTLQQIREALEGGCYRTVHYKYEGSEALKKAINIMKPAMLKFHQEYQAYMFQVAVTIVFHKPVDPAVATHPSVVLTSERVWTMIEK